jgi:hypothetical protein
MGNDADKVKSWIGVFLILWPIARTVLALFGVPLPDLPIPLGVDLGSQALGTYVLARSQPLGSR